MISYIYFLLASFLLIACTDRTEPGSFDVNINIDASRKLGDVNHIWRFFRADEPNYAYMKNGRKLLHDLRSGEEKNRDSFRFSWKFPKFVTILVFIEHMP